MFRCWCNQSKAYRHITCRDLMTPTSQVCDYYVWNNNCAEMSSQLRGNYSLLVVAVMTMYHHVALIYCWSISRCVKPVLDSSLNFQHNKRLSIRNIWEIRRSIEDFCSKNCITELCNLVANISSAVEVMLSVQNGGASDTGRKVK